LEAYRQLERLKDRFIGLAAVEAQAKQEVRRNVSQLGQRIGDVSELIYYNIIHLFTYLYVLIMRIILY
jgi:hypothetical protein